MATLSKIVTNALNGLTPRQREVILARFGLESREGGETLAAIGDRLHITRERVRQIENGAMAVVADNVKKHGETIATLAKIKSYITLKGGIAGKADVAEYAATLAKYLGEPQLDFLAEASGMFLVHRADDDFLPIYCSGEKEWKAAKSFIDGWASTLRSRRNHVFAGSYRTELASFVKGSGASSSAAENYLALSVRVGKNPFGDAGLSEWAEISPKTVRDKIYLVLKKNDEPLHFETIAKRINEVKFGDGQKALGPTVHNELIKDERFVLVGRGMYGLQERGYEPGIAREVIARVLKEKGPMRVKDVVSHVTKQRFFKPNTVVINLQNKEFFEHLPDGTYRVREA
ncbi:MAG: sigma factor-like helix-turn-helix DNA-binding protein [Minisyncoccia bacterium]